MPTPPNQYYKPQTGKNYADALLPEHRKHYAVGKEQWRKAISGEDNNIPKDIQSTKVGPEEPLTDAEREQMMRPARVPEKDEALTVRQKHAGKMTEEDWSLFNSLVQKVLNRDWDGQEERKEYAFVEPKGYDEPRVDDNRFRAARHEAEFMRGRGTVEVIKDNLLREGAMDDAADAGNLLDKAERMRDAVKREGPPERYEFADNPLTPRGGDQGYYKDNVQDRGERIKAHQLAHRDQPQVNAELQELMMKDLRNLTRQLEANTNNQTLNKNDDNYRGPAGHEPLSPTGY